MGKCPNCEHDLIHGGHFAPPSFGDPGIFLCAQICDECKAASRPAINPARVEILERLASAVESVLYAAPEVRELHEGRMYDVLRELNATPQ